MNNTETKRQAIGRAVALPFVFYKELKTSIIMQTKYCISVDWLQVYCTCNRWIEREELAGVGRTYSMKKEEIVTKLWKEVYTISWQKREIATVCRKPRSPQLNENGVTLKLANRVLYSMQYVDILYELMDILGLSYVGVTRLDMCYDCNYLHDYKRVDEFLMQFLSHAPYCAGHIIRTGSRSLIVNAKRCNTGATSISAMRWGSPKSDIGAYCYNKSLELLEVKDKPWIRDTWEKNGLVNAWNKEQWDSLTEKQRNRIIGAGETEQFISTPVWRFEISIKGHAKDLLDIRTGELFKLSPEYLRSQSKIESMFLTYAARVFDFRMSTGQTQIKNYPPLQVFDVKEDISMKPIQVSLYADTGRTEKVIVNKLEQLQETYSDLAGVKKASIEAAIEFVRTIAGYKGCIVRKKKELRYLSHIAGHKFSTCHRDEYIDFIEQCRIERREIDADVTYSFFQSLKDAVAEANYRDALSGMVSDISPVW